MCPRTSDSVRNAWVTATLPQSSCAISYAVRGRSEISPWIFSERFRWRAKRSSISARWSVIGSP